MSQSIWIRPVIYGNTAIKLDQPLDNGSTHRWVAYVRPKQGDHLSFVSKVIFHLHESFTPNKIVRVSPGPFAIQQYGWGGFQLRMDIYFKDSRIKPVSVNHELQLYHEKYEELNQKQRESLSKVPVVKEKYDEIIFNKPSRKFVRELFKVPNTLDRIESRKVVPFQMIEHFGPDLSKERTRTDYEELKKAALNVRRTMKEMRKPHKELKM